MATKLPGNDIVLIGGKQDKPLTKSQQAFNRLTQRVAKLKELLDKDSMRLDNLLRYYHKRIPVISKRFAERQLEMAQLLSDATDRWKFAQNQLEDIRMAILALCDAAFRAIEPTEAQQAVYDRWSETSYQEEIVEQEQGMADAFSAGFKEMFGVDVDFGKLKDDPDGFASFQAEMEEKIAGGAFDGRFGAPRKKTKKQLEREEREKAAAQQQQKSIRGVYVSLAKVLHPDRAVDEDDRLEKEELMKQVTKAYEEKDLPTLLRLETQWLSNTAHNLQQLLDDKLKFYVAALREQVQELESARFRLTRDPRFEDIYPWIRMAEKPAMRDMDREVGKLKSGLTDMERDLHGLRKTGKKKDFSAFAAMIAMMYQEDYYDPFDEFEDDGDWDYDEEW